MAADKIISVNPAKATLGSLHPELTAGFLRERNHIAAEASANNRLARFITGQSASKYNSIRSIILRLLGAAAIGITTMTLHQGTGYVSPTLTLILISAIAVGFMTVPAAFALLLISIEGIFAAANGTIEPAIPMMTAFFATATVLFGPGKLSIDNALFRFFRKRRQASRRDARSEEISYKAFRNMSGMSF